MRPRFWVRGRAMGLEMVAGLLWNCTQSSGTSTEGGPEAGLCLQGRQTCTLTWTHPQSMLGCEMGTQPSPGCREGFLVERITVTITILTTHTEHSLRAGRTLNRTWVAAS